MCIIFMWKQEAHELSNFKFILAANRDEFFHRPAKHAHFWDDYPNILAGQDLTAGAAGGTWLGITKTGKLSCLTNIRTGKPPDETKRGRGFLISNFLRSATDGLTYLSQLRHNKHEYRPFNILTGDMLDDLYYMNNIDASGAQVLRKGYTCLTNGTLECNWLKSTRGLENFRRTVEAVLSKEELIENLLTHLEDTTINFPDPAIPAQNSALTSTFIPMMKLPMGNYGTRTNTIILVDNENNVTFFERTMTVPCQPVTEWLRNTYTFKINRE